MKRALRLALLLAAAACARHPRLVTAPTLKCPPGYQFLYTEWAPPASSVGHAVCLRDSTGTPVRP